MFWFRRRTRTRPLLLACFGKQALQQRNELAQIVQAKMRSPLPSLDDGIKESPIRPLHGDALQLAVILLDIEPIVSPELAVIDELELAPEMWMERMGDPDELSRELNSRCS